VKGIVLTQVPKLQFSAANDFAGVEFLFPQQDPTERTLSRTVSPYEADLLVVRQSAACPVEQLLVPVAFVGVL
jgi:hypothetical protein